MNMNPVPVEVEVIRAFDAHEPGQRLTMEWRRAKQLEKRGLAERVYDMAVNDSPVRDVLVFTPVLRLEPVTVTALMALEFDGSLSLLFQRDNPEPGARGVLGSGGVHAADVRNHLHQYQRGREMFLRGDYDAMLVIESDMVPPPDVLDRLSACRADVAYGVYRFRQIDKVNLLERYPVNAETGALTPIVGSSLSDREHLLRRLARDGRIACAGSGLGCVLIRRRVLEQIPFRHPRSPIVYCDVPWTEDVYTAGFSQVAAMIVCGHVTEDGVILWPEVGDAR